MGLKKTYTKRGIYSNLPLQKTKGLYLIFTISATFNNTKTLRMFLQNNVNVFSLPVPRRERGREREMSFSFFRSASRSPQWTPLELVYAIREGLRALDTETGAKVKSFHRCSLSQSFSLFFLIPVL